MSSTTDFNDDYSKGVKGEAIFEKDFLQFLGLEYSDVSAIKSFQKKEIDFLIDPEKSYEVKSNLKNFEEIIIEEFHNCDEQYDVIKPGWFYTTEAKFVVFLNKETRCMVILKMGQATIDRYENCKDNYTLIKNQVSHNPYNTNENTNKWVSAFRRIKLSEFEGLYSVYQKS